MIFDKKLILFLEERVTHPIQRRFHVTNYQLAKVPVAVICLFTLGATFGVIPNVVINGEAFYPTGMLAKAVMVFTTALSAALYFYGLDGLEESAFRRLTTGSANPLKYSPSWQLIRSLALLLLFETVILGYLIALSVGKLENVEWLTTAVVWAVAIVAAVYLATLDPIPRGQEKKRIPKGAILIKH